MLAGRRNEGDARSAYGQGEIKVRWRIDVIFLTRRLPPLPGIPPVAATAAAAAAAVLAPTTFMAMPRPQDRDVPLDQRVIRSARFSDPEVCKHALAGLCPFGECARRCRRATAPAGLQTASACYPPPLLLLRGQAASKRCGVRPARKLSMQPQAVGCAPGGHTWRFGRPFFLPQLLLQAPQQSVGSLVPPSSPASACTQRATSPHY